MRKYRIKLNLFNMKGAYLSGRRDEKGNISKYLVIPISDDKTIHCSVEQRDNNDGQDDFIIKTGKRVIGYMSEN